MKISKKNIALAAVCLLIGYCSIPIIFNTAVFKDEDYINETKRQELDDFNIYIATIPDCDKSLNFLPFLNIKFICKEPYTLNLDVKTRNVDYTYVLINSVEIIYSSGKKVIIKQDDSHPLKLPFRRYEHRVVNYDFEELIREKLSDGERLKVAVSLTVMPSNKTYSVEQEFIGQISKERAGFWRTFFQLPGPKSTSS